MRCERNVDIALRGFFRLSSLIKIINLDNTQIFCFIDHEYHASLSPKSAEESLPCLSTLALGT